MNELWSDRFLGRNNLGGNKKVEWDRAFLEEAEKAQGFRKGSNNQKELWKNSILKILARLVKEKQSLFPGYPGNKLSTPNRPHLIAFTLIPVINRPHLALLAQSTGIQLTPAAPPLLWEKGGCSPFKISP